MSPSEIGLMNTPTFEESTSHTLLAGLRSGDATAMARFASLYGPHVRSWTFHFRLDDVSRDDVIQDVLLAAIQNITIFRKDHPSQRLRKWLWAITRNRMLDEYRRRKRSREEITSPDRMSMFAESLSQQDDPPEMPEAEQELIRRATQMVQKSCSTKTWAIFLATLQPDADNDQIAAEFGISKTYIRVVQTRISKKLREFLEVVDER
jgi:RNA polymerase sigma-70 factor, ECF subfamily